MAKVKSINGSLDSNLNGTNFKNIPSETIFSFGKFSITSNFGNTKTVDYKNTLTGFAAPITLDTIGLTESQSNILHEKNINVVLNLDRTNINTFVRFGSSYDFLRVCIQNIILSFPGDLFVNSRSIVGGNITFFDFQYDITTDESTLCIPSPYIVNNFAIVFNYGNTGTPDNNILKNLNISFDKYVVWSKFTPDNNSCNIIGFTGDTSSHSYIIVKTKGNPFPFLTNTTQGSFDFIIKPKNEIFEEFRANLGEYEKYIMSEREGVDSFKFIINEPTLLDDGSVTYASTALKWGTSDGYAIDFNTPTYQRFLTSLLTIGAKYDSVKTDLIARFLTPTSLKVYDLTEEGKMTKLLKIYGREFDQLRQFIDSLVYINKITYDKKNNVPDQLISNLAKTFGWNYFNLVNENELMTKFLSVDDTERNLNKDLLPAEVDLELWRRILINTNYFWKSKGTRDAIKAMFLMIGIPEPFIEITEHVYTVNGKIDTRQAKFIAADYPSNSLPYDNSGYPKAPIETNDFYFQVSGNTDSGQAYMNAFRKAGFDLKITPDNKKSWVQSGATNRVHHTTPTYYQEDSKLVLNTKEVNICLDTSRGVEWDLWYYITHIDYPANSTDYILPYSFVNISIGLTATTQTTFKLPANYNANVGDLEVRFNGILLNPPKVGLTATTSQADYTISGNEFVLNNGVTAKSSTERDVVQVTYVHSGGTITGATIKYIVSRVNANLSGTAIDLPNGVNGDVQVTVNGVALTKGTNQFIADYIVNPNDSNQIIIQNSDLITYLAAEPTIQVAYLTVSGSTSIATRNEVHRIDSFNSGKLYYNSSANKYVYKLYYKIQKIDDIKVLIDGIALESNTDYSLNTSNPYEIYLPKGLRYGSVISVFYIVGGDEYKNPIIGTNFGLGDLSGLSFMEFIELIQRRLINTTNRQTITDFKGGWYPTLLKIYTTYLKRGELPSTDPLYTNGYTFANLYPFLSKYNAFFNRFIDELLPATIILRKSGLLIRNTIFTKQKFAYKRGTYMGHIKFLGLDISPTTYNVDNELFYFGNDGSSFYKRQEAKNFDWSNDYVCVGEICNLDVNGVNVTYPTPNIPIDVPQFCSLLELNTTNIIQTISTPTQEGKYAKSVTVFNFIPSVVPGTSIIIKINFTSLLNVGDDLNIDGISTAIIDVTKNGVSVYNITNSQNGYGTNVTSSGSTDNIIVNSGDVINVILENQSIKNIDAITEWTINSNTTFNVETITGCVYGSVPSIVDNFIETTSTPIPAALCTVFFVDGKKIYTYEPSTNVMLYRTTVDVDSPDIANGTSKLWLSDITQSKFIEYDLELDPFLITPSGEISFTIPSGAGLSAFGNTKLYGSNNNDVYQYDITTTGATETLLFSMPSNRSTVGDMIYNEDYEYGNDSLIISNYDILTSKTYISQFLLDGTVSVEREINVGNINAMYFYDSELYLVRGSSNSEVYKLTPTGVDYVLTLNGINVYGASQSYQCIHYTLPVACDTCYSGYTATNEGNCLKLEIAEAIPPTDLQITIPKTSVDYGNLGAVIFGSDYTISGTTTGATTGLTTSFWINSDHNLIDGPLNRTGLWASITVDNQTIGFTTCVECVIEKRYYIGVGSDNFSTIRIDGNDVVIQNQAALASQFGDDLNVTNHLWLIYPITLSIGSHVIEVIGNNTEFIGVMGAEIYNMSPEELLLVTSYEDLGDKLIFSTKDMRGEYVQIGNNGYGWTCPDGYSLKMCDGAPYCVNINYIDCGATP